MILKQAYDPDQARTILVPVFISMLGQVNHWDEITTTQEIAKISSWCHDIEMMLDELIFQMESAGDWR